VTRCGICERPVDHDWDPYYAETDPGHYDDERFEVALRNHLYVTACYRCYSLWPDSHKRREAEAERVEVWRPAEPGEPWRWPRTLDELMAWVAEAPTYAEIQAERGKLVAAAEAELEAYLEANGYGRPDVSRERMLELVGGP
jgi:hypothetical protein